jgi:methyl-accepting chemotaxis protein
VGLVGETGRSLERIVARVGEINSIVSEIAASAKEQATGLAEVNTAVNQMDQVTQQNAAMVEESTAASHALAREVDELAQLIHRFRTEKGSAPAAPAPAVRRAAAIRRAAPVFLVQGSAALASEPSDDEDWEEF